MSWNLEDRLTFQLRVFAIPYDFQKFGSLCFGFIMFLTWPAHVFFGFRMDGHLEIKCKCNMFRLYIALNLNEIQINNINLHTLDPTRSDPVTRN